MRIQPLRSTRWALVPAVALLFSVDSPPLLATAVGGGPTTTMVSAVADRGAATDHVVVISIDGLRPDAIEKFGAKTLQRLMRQGAYSLNAKTIMPSRTLPSHTSMLTGEAPGEHGITWNENETDDHGHVAVPTVFAQARARGFRTAAFFSKGKFNHLAAPSTLDHVQVPQGDDSWSASTTVEHVRRYLAEEQPGLMFVHLREPDYAGHRFSWMSWMYGRAVREADGAVAKVLRAADGAFGEGNYTVIVTADHGGHGWTHGSSDPRDVTIPWIVWGEGVRQQGELSGEIRTMDTAATALWLLGVAESAEGEPVRNAFERGPGMPLVADATVR